MDIIRMTNTTFRVKNPFHCIIGEQSRISDAANPGHPRVKWTLIDQKSRRTLAVVAGYKDEAIQKAVSLLTRPPKNGLSQEDIDEAMTNYGHLFTVVEIDLTTALDNRDKMMDKFATAFPVPVRIIDFSIVDAKDDTQTLYFYVTAMPKED